MKPARQKVFMPSGSLQDLIACIISFRLLVFVVLSAATVAVRADYPLISHKFSADPTALEFNGRLYLYCSNDTDNDTNGGYTMHSITCISSDDLKNWTDHGEVLQVPRDVSWATYSWAPSAISNNGVIYLYFANNAGSIGVTTSSVPTGPFKDAKGSALINSSTPGASTPNQWYFDPCIFIDGSTPYLYFGGSDPTNARVISLTSSLTSVSGSATSMASSNFFEASFMHKRGGTYYFSYSSRPSAGLKIQYATNSNPTTGFTFVGDAMPNPPHDANNNNHHTFFSYQGNWYVAYHNRYVAEQMGISTTYKRNACLDVLNYNADGTLQLVVCTTNGLAQLKYLNPYNRTEAETMAAQSGIFTETCVEGGLDVTNIANGIWTMVRGVDFTSAGATNFTARIASAGPGGNIELRLDATNGTLIGTCPVTATGGWQSWVSAVCPVSNATARGVHDLYIKFTGASATNLYNLNYWQFQSSTNSSTAAALIKFEAESGVLGSDFALSNSTVPAYITITTDDIGNIPSNSLRVATYTVTFPAAGTYDLYAHVRVGPGVANDDSLFYGNGFGAKSPANSADWILVNNLAGVGFTAATNIVTGGGTAGAGVWKWINLSQFAPGPNFTVTNGGLTQTFQIGARETGLDMDAFVFGVNGVNFTVSNLDSGSGGTLPDGNCTINWNDARQSIDGFGGGVVFLTPGSLDPVTDANMDTLFGTNYNQLALTLLRVRIDPSTNWGVALADAQKAVARGAGVLATPWTPPASMKDNGVLTNGSLLPSQYANYASYLKKFADYTAANAAPLRAISVQNEPDWPATYESCVWSSSQFLSFFRTNAAAIGNTPVMMPESLGYNFTYSDATLNDAVAVTNVDLIGGHLYGVTTIQDYTNAHSKGKPTWMTEYLVNDQTIESAIDTAKQIHECLTIGNMSAYIWWKCLGDINGLVDASGVIQKRGYVMSQFSRFVRPGHVRIGTTNLGSGFVSAYRNTNATQFAIVVINNNSIAFTQVVNLNNFPTANVTPWITSASQSLAAQTSFVVSNATFTYTLPPESIVTFAGQLITNTLPAFIAVSPRTVNPGVTVLITNVVNDPDLPAQTLTFTLLAAPTNAALASLNASNALFTWRPLISQANSTNAIQVKAADNGSPNLSATNNFVITVNAAGQPTLNSIVVGNQVTLSATGMIGPDYSLFTSTNLVGWQLLFTTNPAAMPVRFTDTNRSDVARFYRLQLGP